MSVLLLHSSRRRRCIARPNPSGLCVSGDERQRPTSHQSREGTTNRGPIAKTAQTVGAGRPGVPEPVPRVCSNRPPGCGPRLDVAEYRSL